MFRGDRYIIFQDRADAGQRLANELHAYRDHKDLVVLGIPRGGVPVAFEVAREFHAPLDKEPGTLEEVARLAAEWFTRHFLPVEQAQAREVAVRAS